MADRYNEGKALDAVLRFIEARDNALRKDDGRSPDDLNDPDRTRGESTTSARSAKRSTRSSTPASSRSPTRLSGRTTTGSSSIRSSRGSIIDQIGSCGILSFPSMRRQG